MEEESGEGSLFPLELPLQGSKPLFPYSAGSLFPISQGKPLDSTPPAWLTNTSFSESVLPPRPPVHPEKEKSKEKTESLSPGESTDHEPDDAKRSRKRKKEKEDRHRKKHKRREEKQEAEDTVIGALKGSNSERKASGDVWIRDTSWQKDYFFDTRGDRDNLVFESLSRHDVAKYHAHLSEGVLDSGIQWKRKTSLLDPESDTCMLDETLKATGRYWSPKVASQERRRDVKRLQLGSPRSKRVDQGLCESFISLELDEGEEQPKEVSWDDYVLNKTRKFSQLTHDEPENESLWFRFAKFQDELIRAETRKTSVHLAIDKKIMILERALEHHPNSEDLLLLYLETSKRRDDITTLLSKWERMLFKHSGSYRLWCEYLKLRRSTFSKFSVSAVRKLYSQALQALAAARTRLYHRERLGGDHSSRLVEAERGLVTIYMDFCRFEWQSGHHELAIGLLQAQFEYSFLCPLIQLSQSNKLRLFEAFWKSSAPRIGEPGAVGWSTWMQREEEQIQNARDMTRHKFEDDSSWAGWKEAHVAEEKASASETDTNNADVGTESDGNEENEEEEEVEDDAALLEKLGLNLDLAKDLEVKDSKIWKRWSEEESQRDRDQWFPVKPTSERRVGEASGLEDDEGLDKMVMFDDIRDSLVSLTTEEGKLHFLGQFLEFCNAPLFQWCCSNVPGYKERFDSLENLSSDAHTAVTSCQSWGDLLPPTDWIKECRGRASFVRNTVLLLRDSFSRNRRFQEVLISLESMEACETNGTSDGSAAARALAKKLLKASRQDLMLCAAYASFEASTGNVEVARKVFDASLAALPKEAQPDAPVIYLAYAEMELQSSKDYHRALYILYFLGVAEQFRPAFSPLTGPQVLKAFRGYQEQLQKLYQLGQLTESGASLVICAAMFQQVTAGWEAAKLVFEQSLASLSGGQQNVHYERLLHCHVSLLESQEFWVKPMAIRGVVRDGITLFPFNLKLLSSFKNCSLMSETRRLIYELAHRNPSSVLWLFALSCELPHPGTTPRIRNLFERALEAGGSPQCVLLWRLYVAFELRHNNPEGARRVFFRAIHACPWSKALWLDGFQKMSAFLSVKELSDLVDIMRDKELRIRTDVYEILLEEVA